jgi:hypothetical protein
MFELFCTHDDVFFNDQRTYNFVTDALPLVV